jgi:hypothetical protein
MSVLQSDMETYMKGFEDALELAYAEVVAAKTKKYVLERLQYLLGLIKERKFNQLRQRLGALQ